MNNNLYIFNDTNTNTIIPYKLRDFIRKNIFFEEVLSRINTQHYTHRYIYIIFRMNMNEYDNNIILLHNLYDSLSNKNQ